MQKEQDTRLSSRLTAALPNEFPSPFDFCEEPFAKPTVRSLYDQVFSTAEHRVQQELSIGPIEEFGMVLSAARRVGRIMERRFPDMHQVEWVREDIALVEPTVLSTDRVQHYLRATHNIVLSYQPVVKEYVNGVALRYRELNEEEIEMVALRLVEEALLWRWYPQSDTPARSISQYVASTLKHLHQESFRSIPHDTPYDESTFVRNNDGTGRSPEQILIQRESFVDLCDTMHLSIPDAFTMIELSEASLAAQHAPKTRYFFPVPVTHPLDIWEYVADLSPQARVAVLHNLGYIFPTLSPKEVEQKIGLNTGHLKSILAHARKKIVSHWYEKSGPTNNMSTEDIRHLIIETQTEGVVVYRFHNGRVDKPTSIRTQLRQLVEANGIDILNSLSTKRAEVVRLFIEGYTSEEVARMLDGKPKTVRNHVGHALVSLKNMTQSL